MDASAVVTRNLATCIVAPSQKVSGARRYLCFLQKNLDSNTHHDAARRLASLVNFPPRVMFFHLGYERRNFRPAINFTLRRLLHPLCRLHLLHRSSNLGYSTSRSRQFIRSMAVYTVSSVANLVGVNIQGPISHPKRRIDPPSISPGSACATPWRQRAGCTVARQGPALPSSRFALKPPGLRITACRLPWDWRHEN